MEPIALVEPIHRQAAAPHHIGDQPWVEHSGLGIPAPIIDVLTVHQICREQETPEHPPEGIVPQNRPILDSP